MFLQTNLLILPAKNNYKIHCLLLAGENGPSNVETSTLNKDSQCTKFVPNYLQNLEFPYSESATEFATRLGIPSRGFV